MLVVVDGAMALLTRFEKLNDRAETGIFRFIVTKSVTRDFHRDATTKDFCFGYHRWAISFQRPTEKMLGVHLVLRNASHHTACVVDFTMTLLNSQHFSQNEVYYKKQAKFNLANPMQVSLLYYTLSTYYIYLTLSLYLALIWPLVQQPREDYSCSYCKSCFTHSSIQFNPQSNQSISSIILQLVVSQLVVSQLLYYKGERYNERSVLFHSFAMKFSLNRFTQKPPNAANRSLSDETTR